MYCIWLGDSDKVVNENGFVIVDNGLQKICLGQELVMVRVSSSSNVTATCKLSRLFFPSPRVTQTPTSS